jgi:hypothetical protein
VRNNTGDAQLFLFAMIPLERFPFFARLARCRTSATEAIHGKGKEKEASKIGPEFA